MLRATLRKARAERETSPEVSRGISERLESLTRELSAKKIAAYLPFGDEPDIRGYLSWVRSHDLQLLLPISQPDGSLTWVSWDGESTQPGIFGFAEPSGVPAQLTATDLIVVPALACDKTGNRLGKGMGFYDRALADISIPVATVIFESELLESVPFEQHDRRANFVVTESRVLRVD